MSRTTQFAVFITIFLSIFLSIHYLTLSRLAAFFEISKGRGFWIMLFSLTSSFMLASLLDRAFHNPVTRGLYFAAACWMGALFILFVLVLVGSIVLIFLPQAGRVIGYSVIVIAAFTGVYGIVNGRTITVHNETIALAHLEKPLTIAHLSDIHIGSINRGPWLDKIVTMTAKLNPDIVVVTGDLIDGSNDVDEEEFKHFDRLNVPVLFITGNHEIYEGIPKVTRLLSATRVRMLRNESFEFGGVRFTGLDCPPDGRGKRNDLLRAFRVVRDRPNILLYHIPVGVADAEAAGFDLMLSGHTHAGQIFPFSILSRITYGYLSGLYRIHSMKLFISQGTGHWGPPMRIGTRNEIALIRLVPDTGK